MIRRCHRLGRLSLALLAVLIVAVLPAAARAEKIVLQNNTPGQVVVQASCVVGRQVQRDRPHLLNPGATTPVIMLPGNKIITVYDAAVPGRILYQGAIPAGNKDLYILIVPDPTGPGKLKLEEGTPPK